MDGEEVEVLGSRNGTGKNPESDENRRQTMVAHKQKIPSKETSASSVPVISGAVIDEVRDSCGESDFHDTLRGIDIAISKYDKPEMDLELVGHVFTLGQDEAHNPSNIIETMVLYFK